MAGGCPIQELCVESTCPICLEYFRDPVILDCGHNFCQACLAQHWKGFGMAASCPQCREKDQRRSVRPNRQLANIVALVKKLQKVEGTQRVWRMCEKHQEPLKFYCEDCQASICVVCDRSKEHRAHTVLPMEEASQEQKVRWSKAGGQSTAVQYLKMEMPRLIEHCLKKGLRSEGLSEEELRILLIQHASQPEPETAKLKAEKIRFQQLEQDAPKEREPTEMESFQAQMKMHKEQVTAQARWQKHEWELLQQRKKQPDKNGPKAFTAFAPGGSPADFFSTFEKAAQKQKVTVDEYMIYLPTLLRGELAELYESMPDKGSLTYRVFKDAVLKHFRLDPDHFCKEFHALQPQEGKSFLEFGAKLEEALKKWLHSAKADNRKKVLDVIALDQFFFQLPPGIRHLVKARAPKDVFQAAGIADQLMLNWEGSEKRTPNWRRDGKGSQKGGWEEAHCKRETGSLAVEYRRAPDLAVSAHLKERACFKCGEIGHLKANCPRLTASTCKPLYFVTAFCEAGKEATAGIREPVILKDQRVVGVVSTGSDVSVVCADLVSPSDIVPGETFLIQFITGKRIVQVARLPIEWRGVTSLLKVGVVDNLLVPMIVGRDVLCRGPQSFVINLSQWAEKEGVHTEAERQPRSRAEAEQISSGRPAAEVGASIDSRKGGTWALGEKAEPRAEGDWPSRSSRDEDNLALEIGDLRRQGGGLRVVPDCQRLGLMQVLAQRNWK